MASYLQWFLPKEAPRQQEGPSPEDINDPPVAVLSESLTFEDGHISPTGTLRVPSKVVPEETKGASEIHSIEIPPRESMFVVTVDGVPTSICIDLADAESIQQQLKQTYLAEPNTYPMLSGKTVYIYVSRNPCHKMIHRITIHDTKIYQKVTP